ncbi:hypothetical protein SELMODRAFT_431853 [Selaginella moellendorffii]|uniref:Uncharacterized protein n=1 Tax=Selaginella moellendorffii TaxID=88036 RepID=D8TE05_SELML|nr:hypothetical protein SELMODRAFT_431853 [Selaginella moellendorffii]
MKIKPQTSMPYSLLAKILEMVDSDYNDFDGGGEESVLPFHRLMLCIAITMSLWSPRKRLKSKKTMRKHWNLTKFLCEGKIPFTIRQYLRMREWSSSCVSKRLRDWGGFLEETS